MVLPPKGRLWDTACSRWYIVFMVVHTNLELPYLNLARLNFLSALRAIEDLYGLTAQLPCYQDARARDHMPTSSAPEIASLVPIYNAS